MTIQTHVLKINETKVQKYFSFFYKTIMLARKMMLRIRYDKCENRNEFNSNTLYTTDFCAFMIMFATLLSFPRSI